MHARPPGNVGVVLSKCACCVQLLSKPVHLCTLGEAIVLRGVRPAVAGWDHARAIRWVGVAKPGPGGGGGGGGVVAVVEYIQELVYY